MAARPLVLPETVSGEGCWSDWREHFGSVATLNDWDDAAKLRWIRTRLVGRAQKAYSRFPDSARVISKANDALKQQFEPASRQYLFASEFQARRY